MKIYAIRDRLLDYFQQPFVAQDDKPVLAAVSNQLHTGDNLDWQNAPHHFEIWRLGQVTPEGHLEQDRQLLATLDSLVRRDLRRPDRQPAPTETGITGGGREGQAEVTTSHAGAQTRAVQDKEAPEPQPAPKAPQAPGGGHYRTVHHGDS